MVRPRTFIKIRTSEFNRNPPSLPFLSSHSKWNAKLSLGKKLFSFKLFIEFSLCSRYWGFLFLLSHLNFPPDEGDFILKAS